MRHVTNRLAGAAGLAILVLGALSATPTAALAQGPDLGPCQNLTVSAPFELAYHAYANGTQIYRWDGTAWVFVAPDAKLFALNGTDTFHMRERASGKPLVLVFGSFT